MFIILLSILNIFVYSSKPVNKVCSSCKWFIPYINNDYGRCKLFIQSLDKNPPTYPIYKYTKICREKESLCGKEGKFFEKKELSDENINKSYNIKQLINDYSNFINKN